MDDIWLQTSHRLREIETCIKDDLQHTVLAASPVLTVYVLAVLYEKDGQRVSEVARRLSVAATSFTPTVDRLESIGLIARTPNGSDRRSVIISLTDAGLKLKRAVEAAITNAEVRYGGS